MDTAWTILLLEDDQVDASLIERVFKKTKITTHLHHAKTLAEAKELLKQGITWDCCLLDRLVPDGCGLDLRLEEELVEVPCIVLTGISDEALAIDALQSGLADYIVKNNMTPDTLIRAIRYSIERNKIKLELSKAKVQLERLVKLDPLTGALNRRGLEDILSRLQGRESKHGIILIDIDNFKHINDSHGYTNGDDALTYIANTLRTVSRPLDHVCRIGGDEFVLLVLDTEEAECAIIAERVRETLAATPLLTKDGGSIVITASIGYTALRDVDSIAKILQNTQKAVKEGKRQGKNRVCAHSVEKG